MQWSMVDDPSTDNWVTDPGPEKRKEIFNALKNRIGNWFRHRYQYVGTDVATGIIRDILNTMRDVSSAKSAESKGVTAMQLFRQANWEFGLKDEFQAFWEDSMVQNSELSGRDRLKYCNMFVKQKFEDQSEETIAELTEKAARGVKQSMEMKGKPGPQKPNEFHKAISNAGGVLYPMADAISKHLGAVVMIMCCGINQDGKAEVHSAQSIMDAGCISQVWPEWDAASFSVTERSLKSYGDVFFSKEDRKARTVSSSVTNPSTLDEPIVLSDLEEDESIVLSDVEDVNEAVSSATATTSEPTTPAQPLTTTTTTVKSSTAQITLAAAPTPPTTPSTTTLATPPTTTATLPTPTPVEVSIVAKSAEDFEDEAMPSAAAPTPPTTTSPATRATPPTTTATLPAPTPVGASIVAKSMPADLASRS
ncbi:hypothetical protein H0H92_010734, partial [Tricholoma furcatifolium]